MKCSCCKRAKAILQPESSEESTFVEGRLPIEVQLSGPPGRGTVLELGPECMKIVAGALRGEG